MKFLAVKNYEKFQHYRDRLPPWIKLYNTLLDDYAFIELPETSRIHLVLLWLVASRHENRIPYDLKYLARAIHAKSRIDIPRLVEAGFLTVVEQGATADVEHSASSDASAPLADTAQEPESTEAKSASTPLALLNGAAPAAASTRARPRARERESTRAGEAEPEHNKPSGADAPAVGDASAKRGNPTWLTPFLEDWAEKYGGNLAPGQAAGALRPVCRELGITETHRRWRVYLSVTDGRHASVSKFAQTHGVYVNTPTPAATNGAKVDPVADSAWQATLALLPKWQRREIDAPAFAALPAGIKAGLSRIGGFQKIAATPDDKRVWLRNDFIAAFRAAPADPVEAASA